MPERPNDVVRNSTRETTPQLLRFPSNLGLHSMLMVFNSYEYRAPGTRALNKLRGDNATYTAQELVKKDAILLPLPANIQETFALRVSGFDQGIAGAAISTAASKFAGAGDISVIQLKDILVEALPQIDWNQILSPNFTEASRNIAFLGRRVLDQLPFNAGKNVDIGLGNTINPKAALHFEGMNLKQFDFRWTLAPSNRQESETIKNIINLVKRRTLPTYGTAVGIPRVLLNYPSTVDIFFLGVQEEYFMFFKTCMITQSTFSYTPNGLTFVAGGKPAMVSMDLNFFEMDIHTSEDYGGASSFSPTILETRIDER